MPKQTDIKPTLRSNSTFSDSGMRRKVREKGKNKLEEGEMLSPPSLPLR